MRGKACCSLAEKLGGRVVKLDAELREQGHRSFRKLAEAFGVSGQKSAIERHKHRCLGLAAPLGPVPRAEPPKDLPAVEVAPKRRGTVSQGQAGTVAAVPEVSQPDAAPARAPEVANAAATHEERVLYIVSQMAAGTWDAPRDISALAASWGVDRDTVRRMSAEAAVICRVDRGTVEDRRQAAMGYWRRVYEEAMTASLSPGGFDAASKCLAVAAQAQAGWDKAAGIHEDGKTVINIVQHPQFVAASAKLVDAVQGALEDVTAVAARAAARLGYPVPPALAAALLEEAQALVEERMRAERPQLPGAT